MPRGCKICLNAKCKAENGPRAFTCRVCNNPFLFKNAEVTVDVTKTHNVSASTAKLLDWKSLRPGDRIKVVAGSGPYWPSTTGERIPMGYHGKFTVISLDEYGIVAAGNKKEGELARCYIYMSEKQTSSSGMIRCAHKIIKLKAKVQDGLSRGVRKTKKRVKVKR